LILGYFLLGFGGQDRTSTTSEAGNLGARSRRRDHASARKVDPTPARLFLLVALLARGRRMNLLEGCGMGDCQDPVEEG
jgi:hypothetical protein